MVEVNALLPEHLGDLFVLCSLTIDRVVRAVVLVSSSRDGELRIGHNREVLASFVNNLLEVNCHATPFNIWMGTGVVDQDRQLLGPGSHFHTMKSNANTDIQPPVQMLRGQVSVKIRGVS